MGLRPLPPVRSPGARRWFSGITGLGEAGRGVRQPGGPGGARPVTSRWGLLGRPRPARFGRLRAGEVRAGSPRRGRPPAAGTEQKFVIWALRLGELRKEEPS